MIADISDPSPRLRDLGCAEDDTSAAGHSEAQRERARERTTSRSVAVVRSGRRTTRARRQIAKRRESELASERPELKRETGVGAEVDSAWAVGVEAVPACCGDHRCVVGAHGAAGEKSLDAVFDAGVENGFAQA